MIKHRTIQRFVAAIMLLSFAALFGAAYLPVVRHDHQGHAQTTSTIMQASDSLLAKDACSDCCDKDLAGFGSKDLRCSLDCAYYLPEVGYAFASSDKQYDDTVLYAIEPLVQIGFLRPPIA